MLRWHWISHWIYAVTVTCFSPHFNLLLAGNNAAVDASLDATAGSNEEDSPLWRRVSEHDFELSSCIFSSDSQAYNHYFCDWRPEIISLASTLNKHNAFEVTEYVCGHYSEGEKSCKNVSLFLFKPPASYRTYTKLCISGSTTDLKQPEFKVVGLDSTIKFYYQCFPNCVKPHNGSQVQQDNQKRNKFTCAVYEAIFDHHAIRARVQMKPLIFTIVGYDVSINSVWNVTLQINIIDKCKVYTLTLDTHKSIADDAMVVIECIWPIISAISFGLSIISIVICCPSTVLGIYIEIQTFKGRLLHNTSKCYSSSITPLQEAKFTGSDDSQVHQLNVTPTTSPELQDTISSSSSNTTSIISNFPPDTISTDSINTQQTNAIDRDHNLSSLNTISSSSSSLANTTNNINMSSLETVSTCPGSDLQQAVNVTTSSLSSISTGSEPQEAS